MHDESAVARAGAAGASFLSRGALAKVGGVLALLLIVSLMLLGGAADTKSVAAGCDVQIPGGGSDQPEVNGPLRAQQVEYAKLFDRTAIEYKLPGRATLVALMTALQESQIQNLDHGDADSLGLFQQRPKANWGTPAQIMNEEYATRAFYGVGPDDPPPPGLVDIDGWYDMPLTEAAQAVQVSKYLNAYARHEKTARAIAAEAGIDLERAGDPYGGRVVRPGGQAGPSNPLGSCAGHLSGTGKINGHWPPEDCSVRPDPSNGRLCVTPRTAVWIAAAKVALPGQGMSCWDGHAWNPTSDHPKGRACDLMIGKDSRKSPAEKAKGDAVASWALSTAEKYGVSYVIWSGRIWSARTGEWKPYNGAGGIYDTGSATGGHFDHVHVSLY